MKERVLLIVISLTLSLPAFSQNTIKRIWSEPNVVQSSDQPFSFQIEIKDNAVSVDEFLVDFQGSILQDGISTSTLVFRDDGILGDANAGDKIYTAANLSDRGIVDDELIRTIPYSWEFKISAIYSLQQGNPVEEGHIRGFVQTWFNGDYIPTVYTKAFNFQHTTHVANVIDPDHEGLGYDKKDFLNTYYQYLDDDRHSMLFTSTEVSEWTSTNQAQEFTVANDVKGIGVPINEAGANWGNSNSIESVINFFGTSFSSGGIFLHEVLHRFELSLPADLKMNSGGHYKGINSLHGHGFGGGFYNPVAVEDGTFTASISTLPRGSFNPLDMYLCGYGSIDEIPFPIKVLPTYEYIRDNPDGTISFSSNDTILVITKDFFLEKLGGERSPSYLEARKVQRIGLVVVSQKALTPEELSFYHYIMVEHEKRGGSIYSPSSYFERTHGVGALNTQIFTPLSSSIEPIVQDIIRVFPNPTTGLFQIESEDFDISGDVKVYNLSGQFIQSYDASNSVFDMSEFDNGTYFIEFVSNGVLQTRKLLLLR